MDDRPTLRGIFAFEDEETPEWRRVVLTEGTGGVPKFATKSECEDFVRRHCWRGSNPDFPTLQHMLTTLVDWRQIESVLLPKMDEYDQRYPPEAPPAELDAQNRFLVDAGAMVAAGVDARLNLPFHQVTTRESTINTLKYLFHHTRCGVVVMIRRRRVVLFAPFANKDFENTWGDQLQFDSSDGSMHQYFREKQRHCGPQDYDGDARTWWSDGHAIHSEDMRAGSSSRGSNRDSSNHQQPLALQLWDDRELLQLRDLLEDACKNRNVPDCEFFVNKQKYPHLKDNASQPFGFLFSKDDLNEADDLPLTKHAYASFAPILSFHSSKRYADIPFPTSVAWETATGLQFPQSFLHSHCDQCPCGDAANCENQWECYCDVGEHEPKPHGLVHATRDLFTAANLGKHAREWHEKVDTAFFRGALSTGGADTSTNQRLKLAQLSADWRSDSRYNGERSNGVPFLDAALTSKDPLDVKAGAKPVQYVLPDVLRAVDAGAHQFVPLYEQSHFKYIVYVDGGAVSKRYPYLMRLGSVILKVESTCVAKEAWFSSLLRPFEDHIPIKADLSDLDEKIQWCRENDDQCREIAARASELYDHYLSKDAIHDYVEMVCHRVAERFQPAPRWYHRPKGIDSVKKPMMHRPRTLCVTGANSRHCRRCRESKKDEDEARDRDRRSGNDRDRDRGDRDRGDRSSGFRGSSYGDRDRRHGGGYDGSSSSRHGGSSYHDDRNDREDRGGGGYSRDRYGGGSRDAVPSPKRQKVDAVPQCRRCRRVKSACTCSFRR